jgi:hypothetical protein
MITHTNAAHGRLSACSFAAGGAFSNFLAGHICLPPTPPFCAGEKYYIAQKSCDPAQVFHYLHNGGGIC